jgi:hypothetical protein
MSPYSPDEANSPRERRIALLPDIFFSRGWTPWLPPPAIILASALLFTEEPPTGGEIEQWLMQREGLAEGWAAPAWTPLRQWTDQEVQELPDQVEGNPVLDLRGGRPEDAASVMAEEAEERATKLAAMDRYSAALGVNPVRTMHDLREFMLVCGLWTSADGPEGIRYDLNPAAPLPGEVLPLTDEERAEEDQRRWAQLHDPASQQIIRLFHDSNDEPSRDELRTSLQRLARAIGMEVESARAGVVNLLRAGDFRANLDVERVVEHKVFELTVDWERFRSSRIPVERD